MSKEPVESEQPAADRRSRRRRETIEEILAIATDVMTEDGVNALTISEVARRLGVQPPSIYKYFPSLMAIYDELFCRGMRTQLDVQKSAMAHAEPGLDALTKGLEATGRWALANRSLAQLLFWRPVPNFEPTAEAMKPSHEMLALQRAALTDAVHAGELGPGGDSEEAHVVVAILLKGVMTQAFANEPDLPWGQGRFTPVFPKLMAVLPSLYPPKQRRPRTR